MLKRYIKNIVKNEIEDVKLENTLKQLGSKTYWEDHYKSQVKHTELLVKGRDKEIFRLKESIENLEGKLILKVNLLSEIKETYRKLKYENEKLKKELLDSKNGLNGANNIIKNMKQENIKLKEENAKSKPSSLGNIYEKQILEDKLSRIYKTIEENYYQDGYYELLRIKNIIADILKES